MKKNTDGFTLMEVLIVVAVIAVLVGVSMGTFTGKVNEARQRTDNENLSVLCSTAVSNYLLDKQTGEIAYYTDKAEADYDGKTTFVGPVAQWHKGDSIGVLVDTVDGTAVVTSVGKIG